MNKIKVSVIVPVYNTEKYLRECLDSLVNQTLKDIQIVIVDDGSTDSSPEIIAEYKNNYSEKITAIRQKNAGQGKARNVAFQYCVGEYIGFLDSDDYARLDMFEKMYNNAKSNDADYVACGYTTFCIENDKVNILDQFRMGAIHFEPQKLLLSNAEVAPWMHLYKRSIILNNNIKFPEGVIHEDTAFYANAVMHVRNISQVPEPLVMHRKHKTSTVGTMSLLKVEQIFPVIDSIRYWYQKNDKSNFYKEEQEFFSVRILLCSSIDRVSRLEKHTQRKKVILKTLSYIKTNYSNYRRNKYLRGSLQSWYIKTANLFMVSLVCEIKHIKYKINKGKLYS